jgi:hypothetical protein
MRRGDAERGSLLLFVSERGSHRACLERVLTLDGDYRWDRVGPAESEGSAGIADFLARRGPAVETCL